MLNQQETFDFICCECGNTTFNYNRIHDESIAVRQTSNCDDFVRCDKCNNTMLHCAMSRFTERLDVKDFKDFLTKTNSKFATMFRSISSMFGMMFNSEPLDNEETDFR